MFPESRVVLCLFLIFCTSYCVDLPADDEGANEIQNEERSLEKNCFDKGILWDCMEAYISGYITDEPDALSSQDADDENMQKKSKTLENDRESRSRRKKKKRKMMLFLIAMMTAKAAAVATAASIMIPLALKFISLVATKALLMAKLGVLLAGGVGMMKMMQSGEGEQKTEVIYDNNYNKRIDMPQRFKSTMERGPPPFLGRFVPKGTYTEGFPGPQGERR